MFAGVALALSQIPLEVMDHHGLWRRVFDRGGEREVQFLLRDDECVLPVGRGGELLIPAWGNRRRQSRALPPTSWTWRATLEEGGWGGLGAAPVVIPACMGLDRGVWFHVREGVR